MKKLTAQASTEFLTMLSLLLLLLVLIVFIYSLAVQHGNSLKVYLEASQRCHEVSSSINALLSMTGNSTHRLNMSNSLNGKNYTIRISSNSSIVRIDYDSRGISCGIRTTNITNASGSTLFEVIKNATVRNMRGGIRIG